MARKLLGKRAGESLVELAVSIAILSLIVLWALSAFGGFSRGGQDLDMVGQAMALADSKIELLKKETLTQLNAVLGVTGWQEFSPANNLQYRYTRTSPDKTAATLVLVEVTLEVRDKRTSGVVYTVMTSFLRSGEQNAGV